MSINEKKFLCKIYKETGGKVTPVDFIQIGEELGFSKDITKKIVLSLENKRLVSGTVSSGNWNHGFLITPGLNLAKELC